MQSEQDWLTTDQQWLDSELLGMCESPPLSPVLQAPKIPDAKPSKAVFGVGGKMNAFGEMHYERQIDLDDLVRRVEVLEREVERLKKRR